MRIRTERERKRRIVVREVQDNEELGREGVGDERCKAINITPEGPKSP